MTAPAESTVVALPIAVEPWRAVATALWQLLDDVDTTDDAARDDDAAFRQAARTIAKRRWAAWNPDEPRSPTPKTVTIEEAVRQQLLFLVHSDKFGPAELHRVAQVAATAKELLKATSPSLAPGGKPLPFVGPNPSSVLGIYEPVQMSESQVQLQEALAPSPGIETYGAKVLQEFQASIAGAARSPQKIIQAIAEARDQGLLDVARDLEAELRDTLGMKPKKPIESTLPTLCPECGSRHAGQTSVIDGLVMFVCSTCHHAWRNIQRPSDPEAGSSPPSP